MVVEFVEADEDGRRKVKGAWGRPLRSVVRFVKLGSRDCASWCFGHGVLMWDCKVVVAAGVDEGG